MSSALKLTNQDTVTKFKENLGDLTPLSDFMPKTSYDILAYIQYWENKSNGSPSPFMEKQAKEQIRKLERLIVAGTDFATDLMSSVEAINLPAQEDTYPARSESTNSKLTLDEARALIADAYLNEGEEVAIKVGKKMLSEEHYMDGKILLPAAVDGIIQNVIKSTQGPKKTITPETNKKVDNKKKPAFYERVKVKYPKLSNILNMGDCAKLDAYERIIGNDYGDKDESKRLEQVTKFYSHRDEDKKEQDVMKEMQEVASKLIKEGNGSDAKLLASLFFGNFNRIAPTSNPNATISFRGFPLKDNTRYWKEAEVLAWLQWVKDGCKEKEWYLYQSTIKQADEAIDKKAIEIKKKREETREKPEMSEQLQADLISIMEKNLNDGKELKETMEQHKEAYAQHKRNFSNSEVFNLYKTVKKNFIPWKDKKEYETIKSTKNSITLQEKPKESTDVSMFVRAPIADTNPTMWEKAQNIKSLDNLFKFIKGKEDWKDALNLCLDLIVTHNQVEEAQNWGKTQVEDWFDKFIKNDADSPLPELIEETKEETINELQQDLKVLDQKKSKRSARNAVGDIMRKHGVDQDTIRAIAHKIKEQTEGYFAYFHKQPITEIFQWIVGIKRAWKIGVPSIG